MKATKILIATSMLAIASVVCAQELTPAGKRRVQSKDKAERTISPAEMEQNRARLVAFQNALVGKGGWVSVPASGPSLKLVDATAKGWAMSGLELVKGNLDRFAMCPSESVRKAVPGDYLKEGRALARDSSGVVMLVDETEDAPLMTVYPEERLALVNMTALCKGVDCSGPRQDRVEKLTWRAIGHLVGCGAPDGYTCVMQPVRNLTELDAVPNKFIHFATFNKTRAYFDLCGVNPARKGTYEAACRQGWAPPPTNDEQKAIWDKVHAPPEKPIKITYDKDRKKPVVK